MAETFIAEIIAMSRITIPIGIRELMKLKEGDKVRMTIEKIEAV